MSETAYNILDFNGPIGKEVFSDMVKELGPKESVKLSLEQLGTLISLVFTYGIHYDELTEDKHPLFFKTLMEEKLPLFQVSQTFAGHLLNNLDQGGKAEFQQLLQMEHNIKEILSNERLLDFVEMELLDPTTSFRKWEYGRYVMAYIGQKVFGHIKWDKIFDKKGCLQKLEEGLDKQDGKMDSQEKLFLQLMAKGMLMPQKTNMSEFLLMGSYVQENMMRLSVRMKDLSEILGSAIQKEISKQKGKEGPGL
ncbi:hypothetical protein PY092_16605 [Muricauda sp. 334s03]|jgi:hypothetical protein|uniref:Uncharacterized protein n=1 Tax=Flagellimonas yonaguniensis TaxID=3031325 RepID=A0ABT5Y396_9FLAO|nr:hypothetical protein [[Muricauda] yonaguniensis]MDF0717786.1 hypothetical protein [[Muricauda] yonaguniensis]